MPPEGEELAARLAVLETKAQGVSERQGQVEGTLKELANDLGELCEDVAGIRAEFRSFKWFISAAIAVAAVVVGIFDVLGRAI